MSANDMKYALQVLFDSIDSDNAPSFIDKEWGVILTQAQYDVVMDIVNSGISKTEFNRSALRKIIKQIANNTFSQATTDTIFYPNGYYATEIDFGGSDIWIPLIITVNIASKKNIRLDIIEYDFYLKNRNNPFTKPDKDCLFWGVYEDDKLIVITDGTEPVKMNIQYLENIEKYPILPSSSTPVNCVLDQSIHRTIVKKAAALAYLYANDYNAFQAHVLESKSPGIAYPFR